LRLGEQEPTLRICSLPGLSVQWLARQLIDFEALNPDYRMALKPTEMPANLHTHEAEVNIVFRRDIEGPLPSDKWLKVHELTRPAQIPIASPELAERIGRSPPPADFVDFPLLHGTTKEDWRAWLATKGVRCEDRLPGVLCWHVHMAIAAARMGRGVLLTNRFLVHEELSRGELVEIEVQGGNSVTLGSYLFIAREDRWSAPAIVSLRRFVTERMRDD
jgi:DNA-binding transcriptional LysR family regulator